jgi:hypothetical protein
VIGYTIIASEDENKDTSSLETPLLLRWKDVQSYNVWPPYQVSFYILLFVFFKIKNITKYFFSRLLSNTIHSQIRLPKYSLLVVKPVSLESNSPVIVTDRLNRELHTNSKYVPLPPRTNTTILCTALQ